MENKIGNGEEDLYASSDAGSEYSSDNSDNDPSYRILEETQPKLLKLSIKDEKAKARTVEAIDLAEEADSDGKEVVLPELDEIDEKSFEQVQRIIGAGEIERLKVDQCKVYLRKNGLRLTGNKGTLIQRIKEHREILDGGGEMMYPVSSFELNCKGDACTGDVVLFEQNVYDMFNIASRSSSGGPCGKRIVTGRIVKESYGAAKQQHTFTIEVLWSKGEKPLPPLHPLLIKGRNLYRLKTLRQRWEDEGERQKILTEKHSRGALARSDREARVQEKEKRKMHKAANRNSGKEVSRNQSHSESTLVPKHSFLQPQNVHLSVNSVNTKKQAIRPHQVGFSTVSSKTVTEARQSGLATNSTKMANQHQHQHRAQAQNSGLYGNNDKVTTKCGLEKTEIQDKYIDQPSHNLVGNRCSSNMERVGPYIHEVQHMSNLAHMNHRVPNSYLREHMTWTKEFAERDTRRHEVQHISNRLHSNERGHSSYSMEHVNWTKDFSERGTHRQPFRSIGNYHDTSPSRIKYSTQQNLCRYYAQGRCYNGDRCKYSHNMREDCGKRRGESWPYPH